MRDQFAHRIATIDVEKRTGSWGSVVRGEDALSGHGGSMMSDNGTCDEEWRLPQDKRSRESGKRVVKKRMMVYEEKQELEWDRLIFEGKR